MCVQYYSKHSGIFCFGNTIVTLYFALEINEGAQKISGWREGGRVGEEGGEGGGRDGLKEGRWMDGGLCNV